MGVFGEIDGDGAQVAFADAENHLARQPRASCEGALVHGGRQQLDGAGRTPVRAQDGGRARTATANSRPVARQAAARRASPSSRARRRSISDSAASPSRNSILVPIWSLSAGRRSAHRDAASITCMP